MNISSISPMHSNLKQNNVVGLNRNSNQNNISLKSISNNTYSQSVSFTGDGDESHVKGKKGFLPKASSFQRGFLTGATAMACAFLTLIGTAFGTKTVNLKEKEPDVLSAPYQDGMDLSEMADVMNSIVTVDGSKIEFRQKYSYLDDVIKKAELEAFDTKPNDTEELSAEYKYLKDLQAKKAFQEFVSQTYLEDGKLHIILYPFENQQPLKMSIENFKRLFDIKDGALSKYPENGVNSDNWAVGEVTNEGEKNFSAGQEIIVDIDDIDTKNISFQY